MQPGREYHVHFAPAVGKVVTCAIAFLLATGAVVASQEAQEAQDAQEETLKNTQPSVSVSTIRARVQPDLEIVMPTGEISQSSELRFSETILSTEFVFHTIENNISGLLRLSRPFWVLDPYVSVHESVNFARTVDPQLQDQGVVLVPDDRSIERVRALTPGLAWRPTDHFSTGFEVAVTETIRGDLVEATPGTTTFTLRPSVSATYDNLRPLEAFRSARVVGTYGKATLFQLHQNRLDTPIELGADIVGIEAYALGDRFHLRHRARTAFPLKIYDRELYQPLTLGGYDNVRGYAEGAVAGTRALLLSNTVAVIPVPEAQIRIDALVIRHVRIHSFRLLGAFDIALVDQREEIGQDVDLYGGVGPGIAFTISAAKNAHFDVNALAVAAIDGRPPAFYLRTSLYFFKSK